MSNATTRPNAADMLLEVRNYRTSLESLMEVGRTLLDVPSMEDNSAAAFTVLAENILEEAGHQEDLSMVEGVDEPAAKVELIMQDILQPRILETERVESTLAEKAESEVPDPFHTSHAMTEQPALESLKQMAEVLGLYHDNVQLAKALVSMEGADIDVVRPVITKTLGKFGDQLPTLGVSMEDVGKTQVLGELSDAVSRIEQLVEKAKESVEEKIGAQLDEDVTVSNIDNEDPGQTDEEAAPATADETTEVDEAEETDVPEDEPEEEGSEEDLYTFVDEEEDRDPQEDTLMSDVEDDLDEDDGEAIEETDTDDETQEESEEEEGEDVLEVDGEEEETFVEEEEEGEVETSEEEEESDSEEEEEEVEYTVSDDDEEVELPDDDLPDYPEEEESEEEEGEGDTTYITLDEKPLDESTDEEEEVDDAEKDTSVD